MTANILILTGAGISAESGLGTFRDAGGLWEKFDWRKLATPEAFAEDTQLVHAFYNARRQAMADASPNAAHYALAEAETLWRGHGQGDFLLVTQNIDDLHEKAGSERLIHMHGELLKSRCAACGALARHADDLSVEHACQSCNAAAAMRPHVVWFGEMPLELDRVYAALEVCDLFVAIGTSGTVYPAAGFVEEARRVGAWTVELSLEPGAVSALFDERVYGPATEIVPNWAEQAKQRFAAD
ncbi:MAG: NAD-dependent deacylase [Pseudomonadota bacterium]